MLAIRSASNALWNMIILDLCFGCHIIGSEFWSPTKAWNPLENELTGLQKKWTWIFFKLTKQPLTKYHLFKQKFWQTFGLFPKYFSFFLRIGKLSRLSLNMIVPIRNALPDQTIILMQGGAVLVLDLIVKNLTSAYWKITCFVIQNW